MLMSSASYLLLGFWGMNKTWKKREHKREKNVTAQSQLTNKRKRNVKKRTKKVTAHKQNVKTNVKKTHNKGDGPKQSVPGKSQQKQQHKTNARTAV